MEVKHFIFIFLVLISTATTEAKGRKRSKKSKAKVEKSAPAAQKISDINTADLKVLLSDTSIEPFINWIKTVDSDFEQKRVFFFDTKNLDLNKQGVVLRIRRMHDETYDATAKLRATEALEVPATKIKDGRLECEQDVTYGGPHLQACALSQKSKKVLPSLDVESVDSYFNKAQSQFVKSKYPEMKWKEIKMFGPIVATDWETKQDGLDIVCELWTLPNKKRLLECSTKTPVNELESTQLKLISFLKEKKFQVTESLKYKTDLVLSELK